MKKLFILLLFISLFLTGCSKKEETIKEEKEMLSIVLIDINPSIKITYNSKMLIKDIEALNDDAIDIIKDIKEDTKLDEAIDSVVDNLVKSKYLDQEEVLLITSNDEKTSAKVEELIDESIKKKKKSAIIEKQTINDDLEKVATENGLSIGKTRYIENIIKEDDSLKLEDLKDKPIKELSKIKKEHKVTTTTTSNNKDSKTTTKKTTTNKVSVALNDYSKFSTKFEKINLNENLQVEVGICDQVMYEGHFLIYPKNKDVIKNYLSDEGGYPKRYYPIASKTHFHYPYSDDEAGQSQRMEDEKQAINDFNNAVNELIPDETKIKKAYDELNKIKNANGIKDFEIILKDGKIKYRYYYLKSLSHLYSSDVGGIGYKLDTYYKSYDQKVKEILKDASKIHGGGLCQSYKTTLDEKICKEYNLECGRW